MTIVAKKITIGGINGVRAGFKGVTEDRHIARIYGRAQTFEAKDSPTMGVSYKFTGDFIGVNEDGEETMAPVCYLTDPSQSMLVNALKEAEGKAVEFAFDYWVVPNATAVLGYEYRTKPVIAVKKSEPLLALQSQFASNPGPQKKQLALCNSETKQEKADETEQKEMATEGAEQTTQVEKPAKHKK